jgi:membrane protease YdiL (CAAX protease family)
VIAKPSTVSFRPRSLAQRIDLNQHSLGRSIVLHLLPGVCMALALVAVGPMVQREGLPLQLAGFVILAPLLSGFQLGYLLYQGKKRTGGISLRGLISYQRAMPRRRFTVLALALALWAVLVWLVVGPPVDQFFLDKVFAWLPEVLHSNDVLLTDLAPYSRSTLLVTGILFTLVITVGAAVEELYFRGHLLPRMQRLGAWAPFVHILLFSLYHFWSPWQNVTRLLAMTPLYYAVWRTRNIWLGIAVHCGLNLLSGVVLVATMMGGV